MTDPLAAYQLGPMPRDRRMTTIDEQLVKAPVATIFRLAAEVERWPDYLPHYRFVRFDEKRVDGGGLVQMSANRPFGPLNWPTWWTSLMSVASIDGGVNPSVRFRHVRGITTGMDVEWSFHADARGTLVRIVHVWNGPPWPFIGEVAARGVIGPVFVHGIAARTLSGLAQVAERGKTHATQHEVSSG